MRDETRSKGEHETDTPKGHTEKAISNTRERPRFFQSILFDLNLRISATPKALRTSDQTDRILKHTALIVLSPPSEIPQLPLGNEKNKHIIPNTQTRVFPWLISCMGWLMQNRQESLRTGQSTEGREKSPTFYFPLRDQWRPVEMREKEREGERWRHEREGNAILAGAGPTATKTFR